MADELEGTENDRRKHYRKLRAGGLGDREAMETVWPTTSAGVRLNAGSRADASAAKEEIAGAAKGKEGTAREKREK